MTIHNARLRALYVCVAMGLCLLAFGGRAAADDGTTTPARAVPLSRALPPSFASYDALIATAGAVANDQAVLNAKLLAAETAHDVAKALLASVVDPRQRGGLVHTDASISKDESALRAEIAATAATETQLIGSGASATPPDPAWRLPLAGEVSQPFGPTDFGLEPPRIYDGVYYWAFHDGVDITDPAGTPILAPARGRVVFVGRMMDGAEVVVLAHDNGLVSLFAHLDAGTLAPTIKAGSIAEAGDRIGAVGLTGMTTGYHLHWAVYQNGVPIDPLATLGK